MLLDEKRIKELANEVSEIHYSTNLGYGDEGEGFDYTKQVLLLIEAGWVPPTKPTIHWLPKEVHELFPH